MMCFDTRCRWQSTTSVGCLTRPVSPFHPTSYPIALARVVQGVQRRSDGSYQCRLPDRNVAAERLINHLGLYEKDSRQNRNEEVLDVFRQIANGKSILDLAKEREERR